MSAKEHVKGASARQAALKREKQNGDGVWDTSNATLGNTVEITLAFDLRNFIDLGQAQLRAKPTATFYCYT